MAQSPGQSTTDTFIPDINGGQHLDPVSNVTSGPNTHSEVSQSINGRQVPLEKTEEHVLREDANGKVVETVVRKYDPNGQFVSTERVVTDTQKSADGGSTVRSTTYRSDVNGNMQEAQRATTETRKQGSTSIAETVIERPTLNASFQAVEKRSSVTEASTAGASRSQETVYRRSDGGDFQEEIRQVTEEKTVNGQTTVQKAYYEPSSTGALVLTRQSVATSVKRPDGSEVTEVNLYGRAVPGVAQYTGAPEQLQEQQIVQRQKRADGAVTETLSVRRPTMDDPGRLGNPQKISEKVCKGSCGDDSKP